jgi:hypothetical protein
MNHSFRRYFGDPVECDGKIISCVDALYDLPGDRGKLISLHPNLADDKCDVFINFCQKNGFAWERGSKRFYVDKKTFHILRDKLITETGIEVAYGLGVLSEMGNE